MALVSASSYCLLTTVYPHILLYPKENLSKPERLGEKFSSLSLPFLMSSDLKRQVRKHNENPHNVKLFHSFRFSNCHFKFVISLSTLLLSSAGLKSSLTPSYVKQFFTEWKTIMKCVSPPSNTFLIKSVHLWVENFWPSREKTLMWSANLSGSRKQSLESHLSKPFNLPVLLGSFCLLFPS